MDSPSPADVPNGQLKPSSTWGDFNNISFVIQQALAKLQTVTLVEVVACTNNGGLSPVGFVDVVPMVNQIDGQSNAVPHTTIYNVPYFRVQGGANAIIIDPEIGDIGLAAFASRDISKIKSTKQSGNPGSLRQFSFSDALYFGGFLNGTPTQYIQFNASGITLTSPTAIIFNAPDFKVNSQTTEVNATTSMTTTTPTATVDGDTVLNGTIDQTGGGNATFSGSMDVTGDVTANGTSVHTHKHGGVTTGGGDTGVPL